VDIVDVLKGRILDVGEVRIARSTLTGVKGKARYVVYLPMARAYLWRALHEAGGRVRLYLEVPEDVLAKLMSMDRVD